MRNVNVLIALLKQCSAKTQDTAKAKRNLVKIIGIYLEIYKFYLNNCDCYLKSEVLRIKGSITLWVSCNALVSRQSYIYMHHVHSTSYAYTK